jgi:hypothetical protein
MEERLGRCLFMDIVSFLIENGFHRCNRLGLGSPGVIARTYLEREK